jgi:hypothetical protein
MHKWRITATMGRPGTKWLSMCLMDEALEEHGFEIARDWAGRTSRDSVDVFEVQHASRAAMTKFVLAAPHGIRPFEYTEVQ